MIDAPGMPLPELSWWDRLTVLPRLARDPLPTFTDVIDRYGPIVRLRIGRESRVIVSDPELVHELLVRRTADTVKDDISLKLKPILGEGLLTSHGDAWRRSRRLIAPSFQRRDLDRYAARMGELAAAAVREVPTGIADDVHPRFSRLTLEIVVACLFGLDASVDAAAIGDAIGGYMDRFALELRSWRRLAPDVVLWPGRWRFRRARRVLDEVLGDLVARRRVRGGDDSDLLGRLLEATDDDGVGFTDEELRDELVTLFLAGHETTALALTYATWLLGHHPDVLARLAREADEVLGDGPADADAARRLPFAKAVAMETMRLYPPAWTIGRGVVRDTRVGPWQLHAGDETLVVMWWSHRSARWFDEPLAFRPSRWLDGLEQRLPKGVYLPFGGGPRVCVGNHFALLELTIVLATWARAFDLRSPGDLPPLKPSVTLRPEGPVPVIHGRRRSGQALASSAETVG